MAAANDSFTKRRVRILPSRIVMLIDPRKISRVLQRMKDWHDKAVTVLRTVRKKNVMGATRETSDAPIANHATGRYRRAGNGGTEVAGATSPPVTAAISSS